MLLVLMSWLRVCSAEKERLATERLQSAHSRVSSHAAALDALREECANLQSRSSALEDELQSSKQRCHRLEEQLTQVPSTTSRIFHLTLHTPLSDTVAGGATRHGLQDDYLHGWLNDGEELGGCIHMMTQPLCRRLPSWVVE